MKEVKKAMYVDGHEHEDVIEYRGKFLANIEKNVSCILFIYQWSLVIFTFPSGCAEFTGMRISNPLNHFLNLVRNCMSQFIMMNPFVAQMN